MKKLIAFSEILCRISLFVFLLLNFQIRVYADVQILTSKDGLSENQITAVTKDKAGRIWIGTTNGLNVFDGYSIHRIQDKTLSNANITDLAFDTSKNIVWVGTTNGLLGVQTQTMHPLHPNWDQRSINSKHNISSHEVVKIILHASGGSNNAHLIIFDNGQTALLKGNMLHTLLQLPFSRVSSCSAGRFPDGSVFLFVNKKNYRLNVSSKSLTSLASFESSNFYVNGISQYDKSRLLVSTFNEGLYLYNISTRQVSIPEFLKDFNSHNHRNMFAAVLKNGTVYVAMDNYHFSSISTTDNYYRNISSQYKTFFEGRQYNCLFIDNQNTVWLGTNKGLIKLPNEKRLFRKALQSDPNNISTRNIIQATNKDIYVASYNGLYQYSSRNKSWQLYQKSNRPNASATVEKGQSLYKYDVQPYTLMLEADQQNILIGMEGPQILRFNIQSKQFFNLQYRFRDSQRLPGIFSFAQTPSGEIEAASNIGLISFRPPSNNILEFNLSNKLISLGQNIAIHTVSYSQLRKKIILGTSNGIFILDTNRQIQAHFSTTTTPRLSNNDVLCFLEDEKGNIWAGTNGGGINKISADLRSITNINSEKGLSNDIIYGILSDNSQNLWISTFDGLNRYDPHNDGIRCYYREQGLPTDEFNRHSSLKAADGTLYFGSINGIISFKPDNLETRSLPPFKIFLSGITKWDAKQKSLKYDMTQPLDKDDRLTVIKHKNDLITDLHFGCSDYSVITKNKFQYRIKGITKDWTSIAGSNSFNINGLPFGKFLLEVRAINYRGQISQNTLMIYINNVKPLYQLWWFYALILLIISGIIYAVFTFRLHKYKSSVQLRMRIASSLHDEVGSILTRITMIAESMNFNRKGNVNKLQNDLAKLTALSRAATASMSDVLWAVDSRNDFSGSLTDRMREHAEDMFNTGTDLIFDFSANNHDTRLPQVLRKELYLIYKEALHNIAKHVPKATFIHIEFHFQPHSFHLLITNDGADVQWKEYGTGQGLKNIRKRARAIAADCLISRNENKHTFSVKIFK